MTSMPVLLLRADGVHRNTNRQGLNFVHVLSEMVGDIGLVEDHHRPRAAFVGQDQVALQPARVVVAVEAHHDEDGVDVGGDDLLFGQLAGDLARELAAARQDRLDGAGRLAGRRPHRDPVADGRQAVRLMPQPSGMLRLQFARLGEDAVDVVEFDGDAAGTSWSAAKGANAFDQSSSHPRSFRSNATRALG